MSASRPDNFATPTSTLPIRHIMEHTSSHSAQSSVTMLDAPPTIRPSHPSQLDSEIADEEARMEMYGGDDVREPPLLSPKRELSSFEASSPSSAPVTWDGPQDPHNPQNWTVLRKWLLTILCAGMTVNVYEYIFCNFVNSNLPSVCIFQDVRFVSAERRDI